MWSHVLPVEFQECIPVPVVKVPSKLAEDRGRPFWTPVLRKFIIRKQYHAENEGVLVKDIDDKLFFYFLFLFIHFFTKVSYFLLYCINWLIVYLASASRPMQPGISFAKLAYNIGTVLLPENLRTCFEPSV